MSLPDPSTPLVTHVLVADNGHARLMRLIGPHKKRSIVSHEISGDYAHADPQQLLGLVEDAADR